MKKIEAIIRDSKFQSVKSALNKIGVKGLTTYEVKGRGDQVGDTASAGRPGSFIADDLIPKRKIEIVCIEEELNKIVNSIAINASTGEMGDGKIFVSDVSDVIRIRTTEHGQVAV